MCVCIYIYIYIYTHNKKLGGKGEIGRRKNWNKENRQNKAMHTTRTHSTCSVAPSLDRAHDYKNNVQYTNYFKYCSWKFAKNMQRYAAPEIKSKIFFFFLYGEDIPYSEFCKPVRILLNKMFVFFVFFFNTAQIFRTCSFTKQFVFF